MRPINRIQPVGPPTAYKTYGAEQPLQTHFRQGTCAEAECGPHRSGWVTAVDESTDLGRQQAYYIRRESGRRFVEQRTEAGMTEFAFEAGQRCFRTHRIPLEREAVFYVQDGDWRVNGRRRVRSGQSWHDDFAEHLDRLKTNLERG